WLRGGGWLHPVRNAHRRSVQACAWTLPRMEMRWCFVAALGALAAPAAAKEIAVYRCESPAGVPVYSDQPCGAGTVLRLDREGTRPPVAAEGIAAEAPAEAPPGTCPARTAADLPAAVSDAFASGDANR